MIKLLLLVAVLAAARQWIPALVLTLPLVWVAARRATVRATGVGMVRTGTRRILTGRL